MDIQNLEKFGKDAFINKLKARYKNRLDKSMANIKTSSDSKLQLFIHLFHNFTVPYYLNAGMSKAKRSLMSKLRLSCHALNIETLRYCRPKIQRNKGFCPFCPNSVESEIHFILKCTKYDHISRQNKYITESEQTFKTNIDLVNHVLNPKTRLLCKNLIHSLEIAFDIRKSLTSI